MFTLLTHCPSCMSAPYAMPMVRTFLELIVLIQPLPFSTFKPSFLAVVSYMNRSEALMSTKAFIYFHATMISTNISLFSLADLLVLIELCMIESSLRVSISSSPFMKIVASLPHFKQSRMWSTPLHRKQLSGYRFFLSPSLNNFHLWKSGFLLPLLDGLSLSLSLSLF